MNRYFKEDKRTEPDWDNLDPGIHQLVSRLWDAGFDVDEAGSSPPHVIVQSTAEQMIAESHRLHRLVKHVPRYVESCEANNDDERTCGIDACYDPGIQDAFIVLWGIADVDLGEV